MEVLQMQNYPGFKGNRGFDMIDQDAVGVAQESADGALMLRSMGVIGVVEAMTR